MRKLGLKVTVGSGSGWIEKEDGENEYILAQHKCTDAVSYKLSLLDMKTLEHNAMVAHKIPLFLVQFLSEDKTYAIVNVADLPSIADILDTEYESVYSDKVVVMAGQEKSQTSTHARIESGNREKFYKQIEKESNKNGRQKGNNSKSFL